MNGDSLKRRFFIAVFPPRHVTENLGAVHKKAPRGSDDWNWKQPADFHISLAFPGLLTDREMSRLVHILKKIEMPSFDLAFDNLSFFPGRVEKRAVLWATPDKNTASALYRLQDKIAAALERHGFETGDKDFKPHLTLARPEREDLDLVKEFTKASDGAVSTPAWRCDNFVLCETQKTASAPGESRYRKIFTFNFQK